MTPRREVAARSGVAVFASGLILLASCQTSDLPPPGWTRVEESTIVNVEFTLRSEYYLGRSVASRLIEQYGDFDAPEVRRYVSLVGTYLVYANELPLTFKGYRFGVLASEEPLAFSTPGGYVFVSRGLLRGLENEDELAGVLAHELGHLRNQDGIRSVSKAKGTSFLTAMGAVAVGMTGAGSLGSGLFQSFEGAVDHTVTELVVKGFSRGQELDAEEQAVKILTQAGYSAHSYADVIKRMVRAGNGNRLLATHPAVQDRLRRVEALVSGESVPGKAVASRKNRFERMRAKVL